MKIKNLNTGEVFEDAYIAGGAANISQSTVKRCCNTGKPTKDGISFAWVEDEVLNEPEPVQEDAVEIVVNAEIPKLYYTAQPRKIPDILLPHIHNWTAPIGGLDYVVDMHGNTYQLKHSPKDPRYKEGEECKLIERQPDFLDLNEIELI